MNTANLQMEGMLLALAALCETLKRNSVLSHDQIAEALVCAETGVSSRAPGLSDANVDAIRFPIRFLQQALLRDGEALDYASIASDVGRDRDKSHS